MAVFVAISPQRVFWRIPSREAAITDLKHRLRANIGCETWLRSRVALPPKGTFFGLETGTYGHHSVRAGALDAQIGAQKQPATGRFPSTQTASDPGLVRLGRLGAVMATRVQIVKNGQPILTFRLPPLCTKVSAESG